MSDYCRGPGSMSRGRRFLAQNVDRDARRSDENETLESGIEEKAESEHQRPTLYRKQSIDQAAHLPSFLARSTRRATLSSSAPLSLSLRRSSSAATALSVEP